MYVSLMGCLTEGEYVSAQISSVMKCFLQTNMWNPVNEKQVCALAAMCTVTEVFESL